MTSLQSPKRPLENRISNQEFAVRKMSSIHSPSASKFKEATVDSLSISTTSNSMTTSSSLETTLDSLNVGLASDDEILQHSFTIPPSPTTSSSSFPSTTTSTAITTTTKANGFQGWRYKLQSILRRKKDSSKSPSTKLQPSKKAAEMRTNNVEGNGSTSSTPSMSSPNIQEPLKDSRGKNNYFQNENSFSNYKNNFTFSLLEASKFSAGLVKLISVSHPITVCVVKCANPKEGGKTSKAIFVAIFLEQTPSSKILENSIFICVFAFSWKMGGLNEPVNLLKKQWEMHSDQKNVSTNDKGSQAND